MTDPFDFVAVQALSLERPAYVKVLAVVLVLLIAISAALALFTRALDELTLGIGTLILGVWGIRSVLIPPGSRPSPRSTSLSHGCSCYFCWAGCARRALLSSPQRSTVATASWQAACHQTGRRSAFAPKDLSSTRSES